MNPLTATLITIVLIVATAYFVILEFSLLAARRHRLEETADVSRSSRAALRNLNELTLMLAGAQLGITACTFALGAVTKPAVHYALTPLLEATGMPLWVADAVAFGLALLLVTFLHLVVGEMAPKSWAIAHPEVASRAVALLTRGVMWPVRPLLSWLNRLTNRLVAATGVTPVDRAAVGGYDAATLRALVEHSTSLGVLDHESGAQLAGVIELEDLAVLELLGSRPTTHPTVPLQATVAEVQRHAAKTGSMRVLIEGDQDTPVRVLHVRNTLLEPPDAPAAPLARPALMLDGAATVQEAFVRMRESSEQLAVVCSQGRPVGVVTWEDVLTRIWPRTGGAGAGAALPSAGGAS